MLLLFGIVAFAFLMSLGTQPVQDFIDPKNKSRRTKRPTRLQTPWGPSRTIKAPKTEARTPFEFWNQVHNAIQADPNVIGLLPRDDTATPRNGWNQRWVPAGIAIAAG